MSDRDAPSMFDGLFDAMGADKLIADAWPGAEFIGARWLADSADLELVARVNSNLAVIAMVNGAFIRKAQRGGDIGPMLMAIAAEVRALAERVAEAGHLDAMSKLDPDPRVA